MKKTILFSVVCAFHFCMLNAQFTEIYLDSADVYAGARWYNHATGNQTYPGAQVNDTFNYNPNDPMSAYPKQTWSIYPEYSYYFMKSERVPEKHYTNPAFPEVGVDSNFLAVTFTIPAGKTIRYLDCWGQNEASHQSRHKDLVIILKNANTQWEFAGWNGVSTFASADQGFGRFDFRANGVTDNLLKTATLLVITKVDRRFDEVRLAEFRLAGEDDPNLGDITPPVLSNYTQGEVFYDFAAKGTCNEDGTVYVVPAGTYSDLFEIQDSAIHKVACKAGVEFNIALDDVLANTYSLVALDGGGNLSALTDDIIFKERPLSTRAHIVSVDFLNAFAKSTIIDTIKNTIAIILEEGSTLDNLYTKIELSEGASTSFEANKFLDFSESITLTVLAEDGISEKDWSINVSVEGAPQSNLAHQQNLLPFRIYPTHADELINIETDAENFLIQIFNINGQIQHESVNSKSINISDLVNGLYIVRMKHGNNTYCRKFFK